MRISKIFNIIVALLILAPMTISSSVVAHAQDAGRGLPSVQDQPVTPSLTNDESYKLGTGDKIHITVFGQDDLGGIFVVDDTGVVRLPMIGQVKAAGLSVHDFEEAVRSELLNGFLKDPRVSVEVTNYRPFYIMGEVNKPGEYPCETGMSVLNAVSLAGGFTYRANDTEVYVRHKNSPTEQKEPADSTTPVQPGDIIRVAERFF